MLFSTSAFDMRIPPTTDFAALQSQINQWCTEAGKDVSLEFLTVILY